MQQHMTTTQTHEDDLKELRKLRQRNADLELRDQAARAINTLEEQRKFVTRQYGEGIKKIRAQILILLQRESSGQLNIDGIDSVEISPEMKKLIYNPLGTIK